MKIRRLALMLLLATTGFAACSDDPDTTNNSIGEGDAEVDVIDNDADEADAGDVAPDTDPADVEDDTDPSDVGEDVAEDVEDDTDQDTGEDAGETCGDGDDNDCDFDGLLDCEERQIGTDVCNNDTDGDLLGDMQELLNGTDPNNPDTDGDGLPDGREVDLGLDPNNTDTYGNDTPDNEEWIVTACENPSSEPVDYYVSNNVQVDPNSPNQVNVGNWTVALPPAFNNYTELGVSGLSMNGSIPANRKAAAVYDDPTNEVAGFVLSYTPNTTQTSPTDVLNSLSSAIASQGNVEQNSIGGEISTHDFNTFAVGRFLINSSTGLSYRELRDNLLFSMAPFGRAEVTGLPAVTGADYNEYRIFVSAIYRDKSNEDQVLISVALAPATKYEGREKVQFRMDDLTNTTNIAESVDGNQVRCNIFEPKESTKADFYWVLDQSGSMSDDYNRVQSVANQFYNELRNTGLDYRLGVTTMDEAYNGRLLTPGWHTDLNSFLAAVNAVINWSGNGYAEFGLKVAEEGIKFMKGISGTPPANERIRPDAQLITIWISDEEAQSIQDNPLSGGTGQQLLQNWIQFFSNNTVGFSIVGTGSGCGSHGEAYQHVAQGTRGSFASLCATDISETIADIIFAASGYAGYELPDTPISSTLRVFINGDWVPRSRENGFDYFAQSNSLAFFGSYRPEVNATPPDNISVTYETFQDRSKD